MAEETTEVVTEDGNTEEKVPTVEEVTLGDNPFFFLLKKIEELEFRIKRHGVN